ncbi:MAG: YraN family protein [Christensenellales bacterium]
MNRGEAGEEKACIFLVNKGYEVIIRNYRTPYGELDIVARNGDTLAIVEVKSRGSARYGSPAEYVTKKKRQKICRAAGIYLSKMEDSHCNIRFDIIEVYLRDGKINHIPNAFAFEIGDITA